MKKIAIKAENISKQYRLGEVGTGTLSHDLNRFWYKIRGKEDPYLKIGESNDRTSKGKSQYVWSLRDVNFEIEKGDAVGIIGRNGAGKSTLLKLLSKVTKPTFGSFKVNGRITSLLEVGTGFNPEMTGRENTYLNGAILGMRRAEITRKLDEIIAFSGVERYIDTPVKRYSSGMYVRLAFAVAAHLESEILIFDEVLAVGDAEFQKKCLGKMGEVSKGEGRTVLFVSHNITAVKELCNKGIVLKNGQIDFLGSADEAAIHYQKGGELQTTYKHTGSLETALGNDNIRIIEFSTNVEVITISTGVIFKLIFYNYLKGINLDVTFELKTAEEVVVFHHGTLISKNNDSKKGFYSVEFEIPGNLLNAGHYYFRIIFGKNQREGLYINNHIINFSIGNEILGSNMSILAGVIRPNIIYNNSFQENYQF